jgi:hypothetical protein
LLAIAVPHQVSHGYRWHHVFVSGVFQKLFSSVSFVCCDDYIRMLQVYVSSVSVCFLRMFHMFHLYVSCVSFWCCICCNGYTRMFQMYVPHVSSILVVCCKCMFQIFLMFSDACFMCFI